MDQQKVPKSGRVPSEEDRENRSACHNNRKKPDRRSFMKAMAGAAGVFAVSTLPWGVIAAKGWSGAQHKIDTQQKIVDAAEVKAGDAFPFAYPGSHDSALLIRLGENEFKAYRSVCSHMKCSVVWNKEKGEMACPCHRGSFDARTGEPIAGPPKRPLAEVRLAIRQGAVYAIGVKLHEP